MTEKIQVDPREISLVFGKTGMGKSNWIKVYLESLKRVIILDPMDEYPALEFVDMAKEEMEEYLKGKETFRVKSCNILDLDSLCEIASRGDDRDDPDAMRNVTLIIEEAQRCLPASRLDLPEALQKIIFLGRHFGRSLVIAAQRPSIVHIAARSQWTRIVSFNLTEVNDVRWIEGTSGYDVQREYDIRKLSIGNYYEITPGTFESKRAPFYVPKRRKENKTREERFQELFSVVNL
jgi:DNA helicase HerA-like ATPase